MKPFPLSVQFMKPKRFQPELLCGLALEIGCSLSLAAAAADSAGTRPARTSQAIRWAQIGAKAGADYKGDGLAVSATAPGARLRCVFQRLEGEATPEGLWLTSTATNPVNERFRVVATAVGRQSIVGDEVTRLTSNAGTHPEPANERMEKRQRTAALQD